MGKRTPPPSPPSPPLWPWSSSQSFFFWALYLFSTHAVSASIMHAMSTMPATHTATNTEYAAVRASPAAPAVGGAGGG